MYPERLRLSTSQCNDRFATASRQTTRPSPLTPFANLKVWVNFSPSASWSTRPVEAYAQSVPQQPRAHRPRRASNISQLNLLQLSDLVERRTSPTRKLGHTSEASLRLKYTLTALRSTPNQSSPSHAIRAARATLFTTV